MPTTVSVGAPETEVPNMKILPTTALSIALWLPASVLFSACASNPTGELESLRDKVCACKTQACVDELQKNSTDLEKKLEELSAENQKKVLAISVEMMECAERIGASKP